MTWRETNDLPTILAALDNGWGVHRYVGNGGWVPLGRGHGPWLRAHGLGWRFRIEVPDAPSLPPGVVATWKAQAKDCPALVDAGWTVRWIELGDPVSDADLAAHADILPDEWFEVCPPEGER